MTGFPASPGPHGSVVVRPKGRLNVAVSRRLREDLSEIVADGNTRVVVDLTDVETIDSASIGSLIAGLKLARNSGGDLRLVGSSGRVAEVFKMTKLTQLLVTYPTVEDAFAS